VELQQVQWSHQVMDIVKRICAVDIRDMQQFVGTVERDIHSDMEDCLNELFLGLQELKLEVYVFTRPHNPESLRSPSNSNKLFNQLLV
jgi:hypothetical protein